MSHASLTFMVEIATEVPSEAEALMGAWQAAGARVDAAGTPLVERALAALGEETAEIASGAKESAALLASLKLDLDSLVAALLAATAAGRMPRAAVAERFGAGIANLVEGARRMEDIQQLRPGLGTAKQTDHGAQLEALRQMLLALSLIHI